MKVLILTPLNEDNKQLIEKEFPDFTFHYSTRHSITQEEVDSHDVIIGNPASHVDINRENIKLLQVNSAGSDEFTKPGVLHPNTLLANASGAHSDTIAELVIGLLLTVNKRINVYLKKQEERTWIKPQDGKEIFHSNVLIVGFGDIGYEIARRLRAFKCHIIGVKRRMMPLPDVLDELYTTDELNEVLPKADFVISCLPQTKDTIHIYNETTFSLMKDDATFLNIGRGSAVDTNALMKALDQGKFDHVCLDVMEEEPLPADHKLWTYDKVTITPHVGGGYQWNSTQENFTKLVISNLHHLMNEERLDNEVDFTTGYRKITTYKE